MEKKIFRTTSPKNPHEDRPTAGHCMRFKEENLRIEVQQVRDMSEAEIIGGNTTLLAMKNPTSFLIGTSTKGLKLIEQGAQIYSARFPGHPGALTEIVYIDSLDSYLLAYDSQIYRKDIDYHPPYLFLDHSCGLVPGASFRYSSLSEKLIISLYSNHIGVVDLRRKQVEIAIQKMRLEMIQDLTLFGEKNNKVAYITYGGKINVYSFNFKLRKLYGRSSLGLGFIGDQRVFGKSLAVCKQNQYIFVCLRTGYPNGSCRIVMIKIKGRALIRQSTVNEWDQNLNMRLSVEFWGRVGKHLIWVGLTRLSGFFHLYDYNTESGVMKELVEKRAKHQVSQPLKFVQLGEYFYYSGKLGLISKLSIRI